MESSLCLPFRFRFDCSSDFHWNGKEDRKKEEEEEAATVDFFFVAVVFGWLSSSSSSFLSAGVRYERNDIPSEKTGQMKDSRWAPH